MECITGNWMRGPKEELRPISIHLTHILRKCSIYLFKQFLATFVDDLEGRDKRVGHENDQILGTPMKTNALGSSAASDRKNIVSMVS